MDPLRAGVHLADRAFNSVFRPLWSADPTLGDSVDLDGRPKLRRDVARQNRRSRLPAALDPAPMSLAGRAPWCASGPMPRKRAGEIGSP